MYGYISLIVIALLAHDVSRGQIRIVVGGMLCIACAFLLANWPTVEKKAPYTANDLVVERDYRWREDRLGQARASTWGDHPPALIHASDDFVRLAGLEVLNEIEVAFSRSEFHGNSKLDQLTQFHSKSIDTEIPIQARVTGVSLMTGSEANKKVLLRERRHRMFLWGTRGLMTLGFLLLSLGIRAGYFGNKSTRK